VSELGALIGRFGYIAVFGGALFEGETMLILGGLSAHRGYLQLPLVVLSAFAGGMLGDQVAYWLGRRYGDRVLARLDPPEAAVNRLRGLIRRSAPVAIMANRFLYGLRTIGPVVIATAGVPPARFALFNAIGAAVWALAIVGAGYLFGHAVEAVLGRAHRYEEVLFAVVLAVGLVAWMVLHRRRRRGAR
jgi:membrane protein DedA with SNARE-associated domain